MTKAEERRALLNAQQTATQPQTTQPTMTKADQRRMYLENPTMQVQQPVVETPVQQAANRHAQVAANPVQENAAIKQQILHNNHTNQAEQAKQAQLKEEAKSIEEKLKSGQVINNPEEIRKLAQAKGIDQNTIDYTIGYNEASKKIAKDYSSLAPTGVNADTIKNWNELASPQTKFAREFGTQEARQEGIAAGDTTKYLEYRDKQKEAKANGDYRNEAKYGTLRKDFEADYKKNMEEPENTDVVQTRKDYEDWAKTIVSDLNNYKNATTPEQQQLFGQAYLRDKEEYDKAYKKYADALTYDELKNNNMLIDSEESFRKNVLGGTANIINSGYSLASTLQGADASKIDSNGLYDFVHSDEKFNGVNPLLVGGTTSYLTPAIEQLAKLRVLYPYNLRLERLTNEIMSKSYKGSAEDIKNELDTIQKEIYQNFKDVYTQDELDAVADQLRHNEVYGDFAAIPNAFGTTGNMVPSILLGIATGGVGEALGGGSMAVAGTAANRLQQLGAMGSLGGGAYSQAMDEALANGATYNQAQAYGVLSGATEVGTEMLGGETVNKFLGQTGKSALSKLFGNAIDSLGIESKVGRIVANTISDVAGESTEEMISEALNPLWKAITYDPNALPQNAEEMTEYFKNILKAGVEAIPSTLLMQGAGVAGNVVKVQQVENGIIKSINESDLSQIVKNQLINEVRKASTDVKLGLEEADYMKDKAYEKGFNLAAQSEQMKQRIPEGYTLPQSTVDILAYTENNRPGLTIAFDKNIQGNGTFVDNGDGTRTITLNPNSQRAVEFTLTHELGHDLKGTQEYSQLQDLLLDYAKGKKGYEKSLQALEKTYKESGANFNLEDEATNDILGSAIGEQEFYNKLAENPTLFNRVTSSIKNILGNKESKLKNKVEKLTSNALKQEYNPQKPVSEPQYSIQTREDGSKYVKVDTDQHIFDGVSEKDYNKVAKKYIEKYLQGKTALAQNDEAEIDKKGTKKYTNPGKFQNNFDKKMRLSTELRNVLEIANLEQGKTKASKESAAYPYYEYYSFDFDVGGKLFSGLLNIGIDNDGTKHFYEINRIHPAVQGQSLDKSTQMDSINSSIPSSNQNVNYSLSEDELPIVRTLNNSQLKKLAKATGSEMSYIEANIEDADIDEAKNFIVRHTNLVDNYIKEKGINIEKSYKPVEFSRVRGEKLHQFVKDNNINVAKLANNSDLLNEYLDLWFEDYPPQLVEENKEKWKDIFEAGKEPAYMPSVLKSFEREFQYINNNVNQIEDTDSLDEAKDKIINSQDFQNYLNNILDGVYEKNTYEPDDVMEEAIANHGTTNDYNTGAYMTTDGQLLDFYDGGYTRDDHRTVNVFGMNMTDFIGYGAIRMKPELNGFELSQEPTEAQYDRLEDYINTHVQNNPDGGKISIDIDKDGKTVDGATYDRNTPADVIIRDLKQYFRTGKFPVKSKYADFYYSKQNASWQDFLDKNTLAKGTKTNFLPTTEELQQQEQETKQANIKNIENDAKALNLEQEQAKEQEPVKLIESEDDTLFSLNEEQAKEVEDFVNKLVEDTTIPEEIKDQLLDKYKSIDSYKQFESLKQEITDYKDKTYKGISGLTDIANMTEENVKTKPIEYSQRKDKNTANQRKFFENVETSPIIAEETKNRVNATTYEQKKNLSTLDEVREKLDERGNDMIDEWKTKSKNFTDKDVALGAILVERYQQQGDWESAARAVEKLADMGTEAGRAVQMYSIFQRLSPETMAIYQQKALDKAFEEMKEKKTGKWVEANKDKFKLTGEDIEFIKEHVENASQAADEETKQRELSMIENRINSKLPPSAGDAIKTLRRISMLFNPKTQVRNIVGNSLIMPVNDVADFIGTQIDKLIAKKTGVRTTNYANPITKAKGFGYGVKQAVKDYKTKTRTSPSGSKWELEIGSKPFNENTKSKILNKAAKGMNWINDLLSAVMSGGDRPFYEAAYKNSLEGQMKANKVKEATPEMQEIAVNEGLQRTWNDDNEYTKAVLGIRKAMNKINVHGFGLGDLIIPFAKTPANLTKAMVEYSPAGFISSAIKGIDMGKAISRGEMTAQQQKNFVNSMSKAIAGTMLYAIAGTLAKSGAITGSADDDKDVKNFEQNVLGIQPYSVRLGDKTYTYSWANPINAPLAIMADTYKMSKEDASTWDILTNGFKVAGDVLVENSFLQGVKELFSGDSITEGLVDAVTGMPESLIPTLASQIASAFDDTKRQTFEYKNEVGTIANKVKNKIPGARNTLAPQVNTFGEEIENQNNWFNVFFNPANVREAEITDSQKALYDVYEETKDKTIFPIQAPYYDNNDNGAKKNLTTEDRVEYQKASGQYVSSVYDDLFSIDTFNKLGNQSKVDILAQISQDGKKKAKEAVGLSDEDTNKNLNSLNEKIDILDEANIPLADYYMAWAAQKGVTGDKNANGKTIQLSASRNKKEAIDKVVANELSDEQLEVLYGIFDISKKVY